MAEVAEVAPSKDEDTCSDLIFRRKRKADAVVPASSDSNGQAPSYRECSPSASSPRYVVVHEGRGRALQKKTSGTPRLTCPPSFRRCYNLPEPKKH